MAAGYSLLCPTIELVETKKYDVHQNWPTTIFRILSVYTIVLDWTEDARFGPPMEMALNNFDDMIDDPEDTQRTPAERSAAASRSRSLFVFALPSWTLAGIGIGASVLSLLWFESVKRFANRKPSCNGSSKLQLR